MEAQSLKDPSFFAPLEEPLPPEGRKTWEKTAGWRPLRLSKKDFRQSLAGDKASSPAKAARRSALAVRQRRPVRTFAGREVFSARHTPRPKTDCTFFAPAGANSARLFQQAKRPPVGGLFHRWSGCLSGGPVPFFGKRSQRLGGVSARIRQSSSRMAGVHHSR